MENEKHNVKLYRRITAVIAALLIAASAFWAGFLVKGYTQNKYVSSYDWVIRNIKDHYYYDVNEDDVYRAGLSNLRGNVLDLYSRYYTPEEFEAFIANSTGSQSGIGVAFDYADASVGRGIIIEQVVGNSPAYRSGLRAGTFVTGAEYSGGTVEFSSADDFISFITARATGEEFTLVTDRGRYTMAKSEYTSSYCFMATSDKAWDVVYTEDNQMQVIEAAGREISYLPEGTAYLSFSEFFGNAAGEMAELISRFNAEDCKTLILDLRNNGGGDVNVLSDIAWLFTGNRQGASDIALTARYRDGKEEIAKVNHWTSGDDLLPADAQVFVLANFYSASASEALIGVLVSNGIVPYDHVYISDYTDEYLKHSGYAAKDCHTYGKGIMQTTYPNVFTGEAISLTTAVVYWPNDRTIHGVGLSPDDGCRTVCAQWVVTYYDEELEAAVADIAPRI